MTIPSNDLKIDNQGQILCIARHSCSCVSERAPSPALVLTREGQRSECAQSQGKIPCRESRYRMMHHFLQT